LGTVLKIAGDRSSERTIFYTTAEWINVQEELLRLVRLERALASVVVTVLGAMVSTILSSSMEDGMSNMHNGNEGKKMEESLAETCTTLNPTSRRRLGDDLLLEESLFVQQRGRLVDWCGHGCGQN
jgi:hypothetical protein